MSSPRTITVADHADFRHSLLGPADYDEIDAELDEMNQVDPFNGDPPSKRKDTEVARVLSILDSLDERGNG